MFSKKYTVFKITTSPQGIDVERRYNDFFWLRANLLREHPGLYVAPIDKKGGKKNKFELGFLRKRMYYLQEFLNSVCQHPELRASPYLEAFLTIVKESDFEKAKKEFDKIVNPNHIINGGGINRKMFFAKNPIKVDHLVTLSGNAECKINADLKHHFSEFGKAIKQLIPEYSKAKDIAKQLTHSLEQARQLSEKLAESVSTIQNITTKYNEQLGKMHPMRWNALEGMYGSLAETLRNQSRLF